LTRSPRWLASVAAILSLLVAPTAVLGHAELESASPGPDDAVVGSPTVLVATFSEELDPSRSSLVVVDSTGAQVAAGGELGDDPHELRLALPELAPGDYEVRWTSFSAEDNELDRGSYTFTVLAAPTPSPVPATPTPTAGPSPDAGGVDAAVIVPIIVALIVVLAIVAWLLRRQRA